MLDRSIRHQNNFTKQFHHNIRFTEEKNEMQKSKLNLEDHSISGGTDRKICSLTS